MLVTQLAKMPSLSLNLVRRAYVKPPKSSAERTSNIKLRLLLAAAHVKR